MASKEEEAAATEGEIAQQVEGQENREPSLLEIKGLLIDFQTSIANVTKENKAFRKEVSGLKASLEFKVPITPKYFVCLNKSLHLFGTHCPFLN